MPWKGDNIPGFVARVWDMSEPRSIPMVDLKAQYARIRGEVDAAIARVLENAPFIKGEDCALLREGVRGLLRRGPGLRRGQRDGRPHPRLAAYGVGPGDEVITVANTFIATGEAIL
jgi:dTDP-4-amino-4,6-dideoxygalactose transaminase